MKRPKPDLMTRTRAAVAFCNTTIADEGTEMAAFMALFHPDYDPEKTREMVNDAREQGRKRRR